MLSLKLPELSAMPFRCVGNIDLTLLHQHVKPNIKHNVRNVIQKFTYNTDDPQLQRTVFKFTAETKNNRTEILFTYSDS
jgi:hypothetical protein